MTANVTKPRDSGKWDVLPDQKIVERTVDALKHRGITAELAQDRLAAIEKLVEMIQTGAQVMTGASKTLEAIGFLDLLKSGSHDWRNVRAEVLAEVDPAKQVELRVRAILSDYFVGSVQAVTQNGEVVIASASGSQLAAYAYGAKNIVWVVGTQKIVPTLEEGLVRVREHSLPLEDQRMKALGYPGSFLGKILIFEKAGPRGKANLIFVNEQLGF
jgi:L-lactate utilization protein LutC